MMCPGQPSNTNGKQDCVVIRASSGNWDDVVCSKDYKFVCKTSTVGGEGALGLQTLTIPHQASSTAAPASTCTTPAPTTTPTTTTFVAPTTDKCDSGWLHHGSKCYKRFDTTVSRCF